MQKSDKVRKQKCFDICFGLAAVAGNVGIIKFTEFAHTWLSNNIINNFEIAFQESVFGVALKAQLAVA